MEELPFGVGVAVSLLELLIEFTEYVCNRYILFVRLYI